MKKTEKSFTLIELLVVITIIGILAGITLTALAQARAKARDARRMVELRQIQYALEIYFTGTNVYPDEDTCDTSRGSGPNYGSTCTGSTCNTDCTGSGWDNYAGGIYDRIVGGGILPDLPVDPINNLIGTRGYIYV